MQMSFIRYRPRRTFRSVLKMFKYFFFQMFTTFFSYNLLSVEMPDMFSVHYGNAMKMTSFHKGKNSTNSRRSIHSIRILFPSQINNSSKMMRSSKMAPLMVVNKFPSVLLKCNVSMLLSKIASLSLLREI